MGKAARWLKGLLGMKKEKSHAENSPKVGEDLERRRWIIAKSGRNPLGIPAAVETAWAGSYDDGQNNLAIARAAAVAADAAVAAAQAAATVVRLTNQGKGASFPCGREHWAAVTIQAVFRGHLARKALRALKGLVKLQARVRGFLVRKQTVALLNQLHALVQAQTIVRTQRVRHSSMDSEFNIPSTNSTERYKEYGIDLSASHDFSNYTSSLDENSRVLEVDTCGPKTRSRRRTSSSWLSEYNHDHYSSFPPSNTLVTSDSDFIATTQSTPKGVIWPNLPNYMASTHSFNAKQRFHSAPKHRSSLRNNRLLFNKAYRSSFEE